MSFQYLVDTLKAVGLSAGVGGLGIGIALIIFRDVIRRNIFPMLDKRRAFILIMTTVILTWSISIFAIFVYWKGGQRPTWNAAHSHFTLDPEHYLMCSASDVINPNVSEVDVVTIGVEQCEYKADGNRSSSEEKTLPHKVNYVQTRKYEAPATPRKNGGFYACAVSSLRDLKKSFADTLEAAFLKVGPSKLFCEEAGQAIWAAKITYSNYFGVRQTRYFSDMFDARRVYKEDSGSEFKEIKQDDYERLSAKQTDQFGKITFDKSRGFAVDEFQAAMRFRMKNSEKYLFEGRDGVKLQ
jgi:hypothetical protein